MSQGGLQPYKGSGPSHYSSFMNGSDQGMARPVLVPDGGRVFISSSTRSKTPPKFGKHISLGSILHSPASAPVVKHTQHKPIYVGAPGSQSNSFHCQPQSQPYSHQHYHYQQFQHKHHQEQQQLQQAAPTLHHSSRQMGFVEAQAASPFPGVPAPPAAGTAAPLALCEAPARSSNSIRHGSNIRAGSGGAFPLGVVPLDKMSRTGGAVHNYQNGVSFPRNFTHPHSPYRQLPHQHHREYTHNHHDPAPVVPQQPFPTPVHFYHAPTGFTHASASIPTAGDVDLLEGSFRSINLTSTSAPASRNNAGVLPRPTPAPPSSLPSHHSLLRDLFPVGFHSPPSVSSASSSPPHLGPPMAVVGRAVMHSQQEQEQQQEQQKQQKQQEQQEQEQEQRKQQQRLVQPQHVPLLPVVTKAESRSMGIKAPGLPGSDQSNVAYASIIKSFASIGDETGAEEALSQLKDKNVKPDVVMYNALLSAYAANGNVEGAEAVLGRMRAGGAGDGRAGTGGGDWGKGVEPNVVTYSSLMNAYAMCGQVEGAEAVLERMQVQGVQPNLITFNSLATAYARDGNIAGAADVLRRMQTDAHVMPNTVSYNAVLSAHAQLGSWKGAEEVIQHMSKSNVQPNAASFNTLIDAYAAKGNVEGAENVLQRMNNLTEVEPNVISFSSVINAYSMRGDWRGAENLLRRMQYQGVQPNLVTYNSLMTAYSKDGNYNGAEDVLRRMHADPHVEPTTTTYNLLINSYAQKGAWRGAEEVLQRMLSTSITGGGSLIVPTIMTYNSLINAHAKDGNYNGALSVLARLLERGVEPTVTTFNSIIKAFSKEGHAEGAEGVLARMMHEFGLAANVTTWSSVVNAYATRGDFAGAEDVLVRMQEYGVEPNVTTLSSVINAYANKGSWAGAESVLRRLEAKGLECDVITINSMLKVYANARDVDGCGRGLDLVRRLLDSSRHKPTHVTFKTLFTLLLKHPDETKLHAALALLNEHLHVRSRTSSIYAPLIELCGATGQVDLAMRYLEEARRGGHVDKCVLRAARAAGLNTGGGGAGYGGGDDHFPGRRGRGQGHHHHHQHYAAPAPVGVVPLMRR